MQLDTQLMAFFCGHFMGDFVFQSDRLVELKSAHSKWLILHVLQVSLFTWIFLGNFSAWWIVGIIFLLHLSVDFSKIWITSKLDKKEEKAGNAQCFDGRNFNLFIADQVVHIIVLTILWYFLNICIPVLSPDNKWALLLGIQYEKGILLLTGLAIGVSGVGVVLKYQMSEFAARLGDHAKQGLPRGGKTIGILERLLVFMFVLAGKPEGVGFVIAAKSVFRIGELTKQQDREHAEYIMIGTLKSFTYSLAIAFIIKWLLGHN